MQSHKTDLSQKYPRAVVYINPSAHINKNPRTRTKITLIIWKTPGFYGRDQSQLITSSGGERGLGKL